jgi:hypothetical protein
MEFVTLLLGSTRRLAFASLELQSLRCYDINVRNKLNETKLTLPKLVYDSLRCLGSGVSFKTMKMQFTIKEQKQATFHSS